MTWLRIAFALLMLAAGGLKLADIRGFYEVVEAYRLLPELVVPFAAWGIVLAEVALGFWLASGRATRAAANALIAIHLVYLAWISVAAVRGLSIENCGCFGVYWPRPLTWQTFLEDAVLLALAILLRRFAIDRRTSVPASQRAPLAPL